MNKSQMRIRPGFLLGLVVVFVIIPFLASLLLPSVGGPTLARKIMTRRDIVEISSAISNQTGIGHFETGIHVNSSNSFSASFLSFTTDAIRVDRNRTNSNGELLDFWGTPYRIEITVQTNYIIRSAGKDTNFDDADDIIFNSVSEWICEAMNPFVTANGKPVAAKLPCSLEEFLVAQKLLPRSVVVEHNGEAVAPSEFSTRILSAGDRLEIVKIVAGG